MQVTRCPARLGPEPPGGMMAPVNLEQWSGCSVPQDVWSSVMGIYVEAFPPSQRMDEGTLHASVEGGARTLFTTREDDAFAITRRLESAPPWILLEYLAVRADRRGHGVGGGVLDEVCRILAQPLVLEAEAPSWAGAEGLRRIAFYARHGAGRVPCAAGYVMPDLSNPGRSLDMTLLQIPRAAPGTDDRKEAVRVAHAIWVDSYGVSEDAQSLATMLRRLRCEESA